MRRGAVLHSIKRKYSVLCLLSTIAKLNSCTAGNYQELSIEKGFPQFNCN
jgi:hypothetical protein